MSFFPVRSGAIHLNFFPLVRSGARDGNLAIWVQSTPQKGVNILQRAWHGPIRIVRARGGSLNRCRPFLSSAVRIFVPAISVLAEPQNSGDVLKITGTFPPRSVSHFSFAATPFRTAILF